MPEEDKSVPLGVVEPDLLNVQGSSKFKTPFSHLTSITHNFVGMQVSQHLHILISIMKWQKDLCEHYSIKIQKQSHGAFALISCQTKVPRKWERWSEG